MSYIKKREEMERKEEGKIVQLYKYMQGNRRKKM
jgi:hypothetical protein